MTMKSEYSTGFSSGSLVKLTASMLIFGTVGIFRRSIPVSSEFLAFSRGILGALFLLGFLGLRKNRKNIFVATALQDLPALQVMSSVTTILNTNYWKAICSFLKTWRFILLVKTIPLTVCRCQTSGKEQKKDI